MIWYVLAGISALGTAGFAWLANTEHNLNNRKLAKVMYLPALVFGVLTFIFVAIAAL